MFIKFSLSLYKHSASEKWWSLRVACMQSFTLGPSSTELWCQAHWSGQAKPLSLSLSLRYTHELTAMQTLMGGKEALNRKRIRPLTARLWMESKAGSKPTFPIIRFLVPFSATYALESFPGQSLFLVSALCPLPSALPHHIPLSLSLSLSFSELSTPPLSCIYIYYTALFIQLCLCLIIGIDQLSLPSIMQVKGPSSPECEHNEHINNSGTARI